MNDNKYMLGLLKRTDDTAFACITLKKYPGMSFPAHRKSQALLTFKIAIIGINR